MPERTSTRRAGGSKSPRASRSGGSRRSSGSSSSKAPRRASGKGPKKVSDIEPLTPTLDPPDIESFTEFDLGDEIQQAILDMGITKPTPIQALAIEPVLKGKDVIAKAETGTGKTLAFGAPMMAKIDPARSTVLGLVMSPTRELAEQVHQVLEKLGEARGIKTALIVGGEPLGPQVKALQAGAQVVVGTPGRVLDLLNQKFLQFPWTEFAILDEADKMLEIGFIDDIKKILDACNEYRQTLLFSATFPTPLLELARGYTTDPAEIATASGVATVDTINQYVFRSEPGDYARNLAYLIEDSAPDDVFLVFCERRTDVDQLMRTLERKRFSVKALHGGYDQAARFRVMTAFRTGDVKCLVATDVASRGLDVAHVTHVVNLGLPREFSDYTHRIGRTGRAGRHGAAVTFISGRNERDFQGLLKHTGFDIQELQRPRDLYSKERTAKKVRDGEVIDVEGGEIDAKERGARSERKPRRERAERTERGERKERKPRARSSERSKRTDESTEKPAERAERSERGERAERRPRRERSSSDTDERPERKERRPRRTRRSESEETPAEVEVKDEVEAEERPRRRRRTRGPRGESRDGVRVEAPSRAVASAEAESDTEPEAPRRRPRRTRQESSDDSGQESSETSERSRGGRRPRRSREDREATSTREESEADSERKPRRPRRPRRSSSSESSSDTTSDTRSERPSVAASDEPTERRPRRPRRKASEGNDRSSPRDSERESTGKERSERPKRARRSETVREDKETRPTRPTHQGGFGAGV